MDNGIIKMNKVSYPEFSELMTYYRTLSGSKFINNQRKVLLKSLQLAKKGDYQHALADLRTEAERLTKYWLKQKKIKPDLNFNQNINLLRHSGVIRENINTLYEIKAAGNKAVHELNANEEVAKKCFYDYFKVLKTYQRQIKPQQNFFIEKIFLILLIVIFGLFLLKLGQPN